MEKPRGLLRPGDTVVFQMQKQKGQLQAVFVKRLKDDGTEDDSGALNGRRGGVTPHPKSWAPPVGLAAAEPLQFPSLCCSQPTAHPRLEEVTQ